MRNAKLGNHLNALHPDQPKTHGKFSAWLRVNYFHSKFQATLKLFISRFASRLKGIAVTVDFFWLASNLLKRLPELKAQPKGARGNKCRINLLANFMNEKCSINVHFLTLS